MIKLKKIIKLYKRIKKIAIKRMKTGCEIKK